MKVEVKESTSVVYKKENLTEKEQKLLLGNQTPSLTGTLLKYTGWGSGSHPRIISIYPSLLVHWRESEKSKVHIGKIMSVSAGNSRSLLKKNFLMIKHLVFLLFILLIKRCSSWPLIVWNVIVGFEQFKIYYLTKR